MSPQRDLIEAHALTRRAEQLWPQTNTNLHANLNGYPTTRSDRPHVCPCHGDCACPCPRCACDTKLTPVEAAALTLDPARNALHTITATIGRSIAVSCTLLDIGPNDCGRRYLTVMRTTQALHSAVALLDLCTRLELTPLAGPDTRLAYQYAATIHDTTNRWAYPTTQPTAPITVGVEAVDWCANHARHGHHDEPVSSRATQDGLALCDFCWSYQRNDPRHRRPTAQLLNARQHRKLTSRDIAS